MSYMSLNFLCWLSQLYLKDYQQRFFFYETHIRLEKNKINITLQRHCRALSQTSSTHGYIVIKCCFPSQIVYNFRLSSIKDYLSSNVVFNKKLSFIKGRPPSKVVFHQRSSSIKGHLPSKVILRFVVSNKCSRIFPYCLLL